MTKTSRVCNFKTVFRGLLAFASLSLALAEDQREAQLVILEDVEMTKADTHAFKVGNSHEHYHLVCFTENTGCVLPQKGSRYYLVDKATHLKLPGATTEVTLAKVASFYGSYANSENVALLPVNKEEGKTGVYILLDKSEIPVLEYDSLGSLWKEVTFNHLKKKQILDQDHPVLVEMHSAKVAMVLDGQTGYAGTVVVADMTDNPELIAYVHVPNEIKSASAPLEQLQPGDRVLVIGKVVSIRPKKTNGPQFDAVDIDYGRVVLKTEK